MPLSILRILYAVLLLTFFSKVGLAKAPAALNLSDCYDLALTRSTSVAISEIDIRRARERYMQALGGILPRLEVGAAELLQDTSSVDTTRTGGFQTIRTSQPTVAVTMTAPLFQGLKEFSAIRATRGDRELQKENLKEAKRLLYLDVAQAFYTVIKVERDITRTIQTIRVARERSRELIERVRLGKARQSESAIQKTDLAVLMAELANLRGQKNVAFEMLAFLTGLSPHPPVRDDSGRKKTRPLGAYLAALAERPDLKAAEMQSEIAAAKKGVARASLLPSVDMEANYYPYRTGYLEDVRADVTFTMKLPLFDLASIGEFKESRSVAKQAELQVEATRRESAAEVRQAYVSHQASRTKLAKYETAVMRAAESYRLIRDDYSLGLVTNLEVLAAQKIWVDTMALRDDALVAERLSFAELEASAGMAP